MNHFPLRLTIQSWNPSVSAGIIMQEKVMLLQKYFKISIISSLFSRYMEEWFNGKYRYFPIFRAFKLFHPYLLYYAKM